jgi:hypothetical protein
MRSRPDLLSGSPYRVTSRLYKIPIVVVSSFALPSANRPARHYVAIQQPVSSMA